MLYNNERLGTGQPPLVDIAVDPVEARLLPRLAVPERSAWLHWPNANDVRAGKLVYMQKLAVGPEAKGAIDIDAPSRPT